MDVVTISLRTDAGDEVLTLQQFQEQLLALAMRLTAGRAVGYISLATTGLAELQNKIRSQYQRFQRETGIATAQIPIKSDPSPWRYQEFPEGWQPMIDKLISRIGNTYFRHQWAKSDIQAALIDIANELGCTAPTPPVEQ